MRIWILVLMSVIVGLATGVISGLWQTDLFSSSTSLAWKPVDDPNLPPLAPANGPQPRLEIERTDFNFGRMERRSTGRHSFVFKNVGDFPLVLKKGKTSCKCTLSNLTENEVQPGESADVILEWSGKTGEDRFRQDAIIYTNDPKRRKVTLVVTGLIVDSVLVNPPEVVFTNLTHDEEASAKTRVFTSLVDNLRIVGHTCQNAETADFFAVHSEPLPSDSIPDDMKSGCEVTITVKPGLPVGPIEQKIQLQLGLADVPDAIVKIGGRIGSPILVVDPSWDQERGILRLGSIKRDVGAKRELKLMIRGPRRQQVHLEGARTQPDFVKATLGAPQELPNVVAVPLTIEIPPGAPVANHLGYAPGSMGEITIPTNDPEFGDVILKIAFAIVE